MNQGFVTGANAEQQRAIFHHGGVLLSAGAGSGKTFVLVEHIAYLIWDHRQKNNNLNNDDYLKSLKDYLATIVLMTFTKKAAGELAIRLKKKMSQLHDQAIDQDEKWLWQNARSCLDSMTVGTIDGFCYKLISQGFFPDLPPEMAVVSDIEAKEKIASLYDEWLVQAFGQDFSQIEGVDIFFVSHYQEFVDSFVKIFTTPELRLMWKEANLESMLTYDWDEFCEIVLGHDHPRFLTNIPDLPAASKGAWVEKFARLAETFSTKSTWKLQDILELHQFFESNKNVTTGPRAEGPIRDFFGKAKQIKDVLKKIAEELQAYEDKGREILRHQAQRMLSAFAWIEARYSQVPGYTFADLEYYVLLGLADTEARKNVSSRYRYLIVDEFQDTSRIQFDIIRAIIDNDFSRLFCVGDEKQAIYGFRGGELAVFKDCKIKVPLNLSLANNYRSQGHIINFNNALFSDLFMRGEGFEGVDSHPVGVVLQACPLEERNNNRVLHKTQISLQVEEGERIGESDLVEAESRAILDLVLQHVSEAENESLCILYKGLRPSLSLMSGLISHGVGLKAQVKIPYPQDPMLAIFACLMEGVLLSRQENKTILETPAKFFVTYFLNYLDSRPKQIDEALQDFIANIETLGALAAFGDFLHRCGIANSNHNGNMVEIERIVGLANGDVETILSQIKQLSDKKYSIEFQTPGPGKVSIMTTHASKGLQFSHVILGGIHTNGRRIPERDLVGKLPGSLRWRLHTSQKKKYRSPQMIMEATIDALKDFSESKRLFYVACTRAENKLSWIDLIDNESRPLSYHKNSWINGIRVFEDNPENIAKNITLFEVLKEQMTHNEQVLSKNSEYVANESSLPMFHLDPLGISSFETDLNQSLLTFPELSVTKLATISQCPRKFYLKHICKLDDDIEVFDYKEMLEEVHLESETNEITPLQSSAARGTLVHEAIAHALGHRGVISLAHQKQLGEKEIKAVRWASELVLKESSSCDLLSEQAIKFDFFGQMVSGTPDLVLLPKNGDSFRIVDFKTGRPGGNKELPYWFQLRCYAYAIAKLMPERTWKEVALELWYVDACEIKAEKYDLKEITRELSLQWAKLSRLHQPVLEHCASCSFGKICHPQNG